MSFHKTRKCEEGTTAAPRPGFQLWFGTDCTTWKRDVARRRVRIDRASISEVFGVKRGRKGSSDCLWGGDLACLHLFLRVNVAAAEAVGGKGKWKIPVGHQLARPTWDWVGWGLIWVIPKTASLLGSHYLGWDFGGVDHPEMAHQGMMGQMWRNFASFGMYYWDFSSNNRANVVCFFH